MISDSLRHDGYVFGNYVPEGYEVQFGKVVPVEIARYLRANFGDYVAQLESENRELARANARLINNPSGAAISAESKSSPKSLVAVGTSPLSCFDEEPVKTWLRRVDSQVDLDEFGKLWIPLITNLMEGEPLDWFLEWKYSRDIYSASHWSDFKQELIKESKRR